MTVELKQKKLNRCYELWVEKEYFCSFHKDIFPKPRELLQYLPEEIPSAFPELELSASRLFAYKRLAYKALSSHSLRRMLQERLVSKQTQDSLLKELTEKSYLDDDYFIQNYFESMQAKGLGPQKVIAKLRQKDFPLSALYEIASNLYPVSKEIEVIESLFDENLNTNKLEEKQASYKLLERKGFTHGAITHCLNGSLNSS